MKTNSQGPSPFHAIDSSQERTFEYESGRLEKREMKSRKELNKTGKSNDPLLNKLLGELNEHTAQKLRDTHRWTFAYRFIRVSPCRFFVRRAIWDDIDENCQDPSDPHHYRYVIPVMDMTQEVKIVKVLVNDQAVCYLECSCGKFQRCQRPCVHIMCILDREPSASDCGVIHLKSYEAYFLRSDTPAKMNSKFEEMVCSPIKGPLIAKGETLNESRCRQDVGWFRKAWCKIVVRPGQHFTGRNLESIKKTPSNMVFQESINDRPLPFNHEQNDYDKDFAAGIGDFGFNDWSERHPFIDAASHANIGGLSPSDSIASFPLGGGESDDDDDIPLASLGQSALVMDNGAEDRTPAHNKAYSYLLKWYAEACDEVSTPRGIEVAKQALINLKWQLRAEKNTGKDSPASESADTPSTPQAGCSIASLPCAATSRKDKRKKPLNSPSNWKRGKKKKRSLSKKSQNSNMCC